MAEKEITKKEGDSSKHESESMEELLERIHQLEEDNQRKDDEIRHRDDEIKHKDDEVKRLKKENDIFRKILRTKNIDADDALAEFSEADADCSLEELRELRRKVGMNSGNGSLPPSSDRPWQRPKKRSLRQSTGRKPGGQTGHPGRTMEAPHEADSVIMLYPPGCENCRRRNECESKGAFSCAETRTVVDMQVAVTVTEYRDLKRSACPSANAEGDTGVFPEGVNAFIQYGDGIAVTAGILDSYGAMSDKRIAEVINGMSGLNMSAATVVAMTERCAETVAPAMGPIADAVASSPIVNCDETGTRAVVEVVKKAGSVDCEDDGKEPETELVSRNVWPKFCGCK